MRTRNYVMCLLVFSFLVAFVAGQAMAVTATFITISIDENGLGIMNRSDSGWSQFSWSIKQDPGPGGLETLCYATGLNWVQGDLILTEPETGLTSDVIRLAPMAICFSTRMAEILIPLTLEFPLLSTKIKSHLWNKELRTGGMATTVIYLAITLWDMFGEAIQHTI